MMKTMTLSPATFTPAFGMPACGHASLEARVIAAIPAAVATAAQRVLFEGHVANFAGTRDYATRPGSTWSPSHC